MGFNGEDLTQLSDTWGFLLKSLLVLKICVFGLRVRLKPSLPSGINTTSLSGRVQVFQKILSSYSIYYAFVWMFNNYQIDELQKITREFLWSDGRGYKKEHFVKWEWCCMDKAIGGLGLKDLKVQGIALAAKWIFHALEGNEPWKVLIRNNIRLGVPKKAKSWRSLPISDLIDWNFSISATGSVVLKSIWKAWESVRHSIGNNWISRDNQICGQRSIWWSLTHNGKPLALTQGCLAKKWANKGICCFKDIIINGSLISWDNLSSKY